MTARLISRLQNIAVERRAALVTYIMAGDPDQETSAAILAALPRAGADIVELGIPFSDPIADGPSIQAAGRRALEAGQTLRATLMMARTFRTSDADTPLILMGYYNPVYVYGVDAFLREAKKAGVDGLIIVDCPPEEDDEICLPAREAGLAFIRLVAPTTDEGRLQTILNNATGFIYFVSITGVTGSSEPNPQFVSVAVTRVKQHTNLPVVVGFGVKNARSASAIAKVADGVVVGSSLVEEIRLSLDGKAATPVTVAKVTSLVDALGRTVRAVGK